MIISFSRNYVFVRTRKTGSTTVQTVLAQSLGPDDVFTRRSMQGHPSLTGTGEPKPPLYTHMRAEEIIPWLPDGFWQRAFKFTIERHPYEKAVSLAHFRWGKRGRLEGERGFAADFESHLDEVVRKGGYANYPYYFIGGKPAMDDFIQQATLEADLRRIAERIGVPVPDEIESRKTTFRSDRRPAREVLSDEHKQIIYEACRPEFELFGYER
jgi:hypothetical protein